MRSTRQLRRRATFRHARQPAETATYNVLLMAAMPKGQTKIDVHKELCEIVQQRELRRMDASGICVVTWLSKRSARTKSSVTSVRMAKSASIRVVKPCDDGWRPCTFSFAKALASLRASALACAVVAASGHIAN